MTFQFLVPIFGVPIYLPFSTAFSATAAIMTFLPGESDTRCFGCGFIQASGKIVATTPDTLVEFLKNAAESYPRRIRLHSPGGKFGHGHPVSGDEVPAENIHVLRHDAGAKIRFKRNSMKPG